MTTLQVGLATSNTNKTPNTITSTTRSIEFKVTPSIHYWTESEKKDLIKLRKAGVSYEFIGFKLNRTTNACRVMGRKLGLAKKHTKPANTIKTKLTINTKGQDSKTVVLLKKYLQRKGLLEKTQARA